MTTKEDLVNFLTEKDYWWEALIGSYNDYVKKYGYIMKNSKPNMIILDTASYDVLMEKIKEYSAYFMFFNIKIVKVPRMGRSEVHWFREIE